MLEKCGFTREGMLQRHSEFPNLAERGPSDVFCYARVIGAVSEPDLARVAICDSSGLWG